MHPTKLSLLVMLLVAGFGPDRLRVHAQPREPLGQCSRLTSLVISEIMYHPAKRSDGRDLEFIELFNSLETAEDLSGYRLSGGIDYAFPAGTTIPGRGFLVIARNPADLQAVYGASGVLGPFEQNGSLPNDQGLVRLRNPIGAIFLEVPYTTKAPWPVAPDGSGHSLVLVRPSFGERDPKAWAASDVIGGSPGAVDPVTPEPAQAVVINEFLAHTDDPELDYIELYNHSHEPVDLSGCVLTDDVSTNKFVLPQNTVIPARGFKAFTQDQMNFALSSGGETVYLKNAQQTRVLDAVRFQGQENGLSTGRFPDGHDQFYRLLSKTPEAHNSGIRMSEVVINEILFHPISNDDDDQYIELHNRNAAPVNLGGWRLEDGINFTFPASAVIGPNGYVVVAKNASRLGTNYSNLSASNLLGDFEGRLAAGGERIALTKPDTILTTNTAGVVEANLIHIVVDEVTYGDGGRWGQWSDGGGSSLERVDPRADGRLGSNWADSDETRKAPWTTVAFTGRLDHGNVSADQLQVLLQGAGECLIDDVEVANAAGVNQIANSTFETSANGWTAEGTEDQSGWETSEGFNSSRSYHVRAVDRGDNQLNRIRTPLISGLPSGTTGTIRAKVRWLKGQPSVLFRLRGNWLEAVGTMTLPKNLGTPGAQNSRYLVNGPPAVFAVGHAPVLPAAGQPVVVTARASDPDGVASVRLRYRVDPSGSDLNVLMSDDGSGGDAIAGDGLYSATIPGQSSGTLIAFHVEATDASANAASATYPDAAPGREALVRFGEITPTGTFPVYRMWMTRATFNTWSSRSKLDNTPLPVTFVHGDSRVIYEAQGLYAGSPYIAPGYNTPSGNRCGYTLSFPSDDRFLGDQDLVLDWPGGHGGESTALQEQMAYWMADKMGLPYSHRYTIRLHVNGVTDMQRGTVFEAVNQPAGDFLRAWVPEDNDGDFYKIDRAFEFNDQGGRIADPQPRLEEYLTTGGAKKTARYRWTWLKRSTTDVNDYTNIFNLVDALNATSPEPYTSQTEALVDLEEWMSILALEHIIVNFDAYGHEIGKNVYAYKPQNSGWQLYMFDLDWLMLAAANRRGDYAANAAPLFNAEDPTMVRMYNHPPFRRAYFRAVKKAVDGPLLSSICDPVMDAKYRALVANGITLCDGQPLTAPTAVKTWFRQRRTFLLNQLNAVAAPFAITSNGGVDFTSSTPVLTLTGTAPVEVKGLRVNGVDYPVRWTSVTAWAITVALRPGQNPFVVDAYNANGELLTNLVDRISVGAEFATESPVGKVIINEIMFNPLVSGAEFIELLNTSPSTTFDLSGWRVNGIDCIIPSGVLIGPGAHLVLAKNRAAFAAAYGNTIPIAGEFEGNFDSDGETLSLRMPGAAGNPDVLVDVVTYGTAPPWPLTAAGVSLQLIDPTQENFRVANWAVTKAEAGLSEAPQWQYVTATGTASSSRLYVYMDSAGDVFIDDLRLVAGDIAGAGENLITNGDFESALTEPWNISANLAASSVTGAVRHSGNASLHLVSSSPGSSQNSSLWQDLGPLTSGATYTLSYWYFPSTNGSGLTMRLSGSGINTTKNISPAEAQKLLSTPAAANAVRTTLPMIPPLWINELAPQNLTASADNAGDRDPWIEIYNAGNDLVSLEGLYLTDNYASLSRWAFPPGTTIGPNQFLLVWLDGETDESTASALHANFRIPPSSGSVALVFPLQGQPAVLDYANYVGLSADVSVGLYPDGQGGPRQSFVFASPGAANDNTFPSLPLFINEWMAANTSGVADPADGNFEDWIELYNPNSVPVDLSDYALSDTLTNNSARWKFPAGSLIPAGGFLLVWADNDTDQNSTSSPDLHAGFRLSQAGEVIGLFAPNGALVDSVTFGPQTSDISQGRWPDGGAAIDFLLAPTPNVPNARPVISSPELTLQASLSANAELVLTWMAEPGRAYQIEVTEDLGTAAWVKLADVLAVTAAQTWAIPIEETPKRFYRVVGGE